ncbi:Orotidine-5'-phosphate (OMP) decarboxylase [Komagataella phaffii CBS 7435]|uniref:Orotidine 5'-phosphate decarboxylase n=3 Tax=Komagataella TaxID=460517 RepID=PYRF_PICPA|nr:Orotidine-5'-phosphate (OMP) decarboxylase [Komagataella phaffii GS115]Q9C1J2.1 RecName: Full=Orotidine 5'-phosphate decarboxylase; AltName: Full=OMP decarboxylase; Short=OMPDCase; Short=OMPdecase; AltName: Full=Uridine 5'-monophosphate synthase; Short=UMP synthase [Komagataella pastoris]AOA63327.1 GQ67_03447T0 [Komagataella phaffii]WNK76710.1 KpURA3 [Shuttle vector pGS188]CAH2449819.1 Orotidine-5'-phosphate (OMP) decarboxylase [Komagataella phaffii CBS 7435]AAK06768.1 orotidine-5'-phosphat
MARSYAERANTHQSPVARRLFALMEQKQSNLCASVDVRTTKELLELLDKLGPFICLAKTHIDIIDDFTYDGTILPLLELSKKHKFLIFEDRKFADIGNTVKHQYQGGVYKIAQWADITNAHGVIGSGIVKGLKEAATETTDQPRGLLMLAELSSKGSIAHGKYTEETVEIAKSDKEFVIGFIAQNSMGGQDEGFDWIIMTPGVGLDDTGDALGQQYRTVSQVFSTGTDIIIVGRGLFGKGRDPLKEGERYRKAGWEAYQNILR